VAPHAAASPAGITCIASSPQGKGDGGLLATGGLDHMGLVFDTDAMRVVGRLRGHTGKLSAIAWHPDAGSDALYTASEDSTVRVWAPTAGGGGAEFGAAVTMSPHGRGVSVTGLAVHPLGTHGASATAAGGGASASGSGGAWALLDFSRGVVLARAHAPVAAGGGPLVFHPDGVLLGVAAAGGAVRLFDVRSQERAAELGTGAVGSSSGGLAFSENGYYAAAGCAEGVRLFDLRKASGGEPVVAAWGVAGGACSVAFDYAGALLAVGGGNGSVCVFDVAAAGAKEGAPAAEAPLVFETPRHYAGEVNALAWTRAARTLASASASDRSLHLFRKK
jgi:WD40 repeat protein